MTGHWWFPNTAATAVALLTIAVAARLKRQPKCDDDLSDVAR